MMYAIQQNTGSALKTTTTTCTAEKISAYLKHHYLHSR